VKRLLIAGYGDVARRAARHSRRGAFYRSAGLHYGAALANAADDSEIRMGD